MNKIEFKLEIKEKLSANLKTIAKEKALSREHLSEEILARYVADNKDIWKGKEKDLIKKERFREDNKEKINQLFGKHLVDQNEFLDMIIVEDTYYHLAIIAEQKDSPLEQLIIQILSDYTVDYKELLDEKDKLKKEKKDKQKQLKILQLEKKAQKKVKKKQKNRNKNSR